MGAVYIILCLLQPPIHLDPGAIKNWTSDKIDILAGENELRKLQGKLTISAAYQETMQAELAKLGVKTKSSKILQVLVDVHAIRLLFPCNSPCCDQDNEPKEFELIPSYAWRRYKLNCPP